MKNLTLVHYQRNDTCIICGEEFTPRAGKQYCSNACKQKSYSDKKQEAEKGKEQGQQAIRKQFEFYLSEHQAYIKNYPGTNLEPFLLFCFFRKNFKGTFNVEQFRKYMETFPRWWWEEFWDSEETGNISPARKKYFEFESLYFGDEVAISFSASEIISK